MAPLDSPMPFGLQAKMEVQLIMHLIKAHIGPKASGQCMLVVIELALFVAQFMARS